MFYKKTIFVKYNILERIPNSASFIARITFIKIFVGVFSIYSHILN